MRNTLISTCFNERFLSLWLNKLKLLHLNRVEIKLECLTVCVGEHCKSSFIKTSYLLYEAIIPENMKSISVGRSLQSDHIYETRDKNMKRLSHIAETITELKNHLTTQQEEHIIPIRQKILNLRTILDLIKNYVHGSHNETKSIIGKSIALRANIKNTIKKIALNMPMRSDKISPNLLSQRLNNFITKLKNRTKNKSNIKKRSINVDNWNGKYLHVDKLIINKNCDRNFDEKLVVKYGSMHQINGHISLDTLVIRTLKQTNSQPLSLNRKREKRANTLSSASYPTITAKSINNFDWEQFLKIVYRKGINTAIKGL